MGSPTDHELDELTPASYGCMLEGLLEPAAGYALSILKNRADAEDAVQQAALRGLERRAQYDPGRPFRGWWFTVLRNCCLDLLRSRRPHLRHQAVEDMESGSAEPGQWMDLADALERLELHQGNILRLHYFGGLSYEEISDALAIPKGTVMSRLHYARQALFLLLKGSER